MLQTHQVLSYWCAVHVDAAQRLVRVVLERLVAEHPHVLLDGLVGVVRARDEIELGEDLGAIGAIGAELVLRIELLRDLVGLGRATGSA